MVRSLLTELCASARLSCSPLRSLPSSWQKYLLYHILWVPMNSPDHENLQANFAPMSILNLSCIRVFVRLIAFEDCSDICCGVIGDFRMNSLEVNQSAIHKIQRQYGIPDDQHLPWIAMLHICWSHFPSVLRWNSHMVERRASWYWCRHHIHRQNQCQPCEQYDAMAEMVGPFICH